LVERLKVEMDRKIGQAVFYCGEQLVGSILEGQLRYEEIESVGMVYTYTMYHMVREMMAEYKKDMNILSKRFSEIEEERKDREKKAIEEKREKGIQVKMDPENMEIEKILEEKETQVQMDPEVKEIERIVIKEVERKVQRKEKSVQTIEEEEETARKDEKNQDLRRKLDEILNRVKTLEKRSDLTCESEQERHKEERAQEIAT